MVTETSLGRDLLESCSDTADRMRNEDFVWIAQAIEINREVGGNLAEVLDQVNETIRERSQIKGHIKALSAEGKFSAYILMAMPVGMFLSMSWSVAPTSPLFTTFLGWVMIVASVVLMAVGGLWMRKIKTEVLEATMTPMCLASILVIVVPRRCMAWSLLSVDRRGSPRCQANLGRGRYAGAGRRSDGSKADGARLPERAATG